MNLKHIHREDHCLNCGTILNKEKDNFCPLCGQVNNNRKESAFELVRELVEDFLHFNSKIVLSIVPLLFKPGKLTLDYNDGKRARYFHPVRLFLTITVILFFIQGIFNHDKKESLKSKKENIEKNLSESEKKDTLITKSINNALAGEYDSVGTNQNNENKPSNIEWDFGSTKINNKRIVDLVHNGFTDPLMIMDTLHIKNTFLNRLVVSQIIKGGFISNKEIKEYYSHRLPWIIFSLMPVFAFTLYFLYIRRKVFFSEHLIYAFHLHTAVFLIITFVILLNGLGLKWINIVYAYIPFYYYISLKNVYKQSWSKTLVKGTMVGLMYFFLGILALTIVMSLLFLVY